MNIVPYSNEPFKTDETTSSPKSGPVENHDESFKNARKQLDQIAKSNMQSHSCNSLQTNVVSRPKIPASLNSDIKEYAKLFKSSRELTVGTKDKPLSPKIGDHANPVYLTINKKETEAIVFKPGQFASKAVTCAGLARLVGLGRSIPPAKIGTANIKDNSEYTRLSTNFGLHVLVNSEALQEVEDVQIAPETKSATCRMDNLNIKLTPFGYGYKAKIEKASLFEAAVEKGEKFVLLTDDEEISFLAPKTEIYPIKQKKQDQFVNINNFTYSVKKEDDGLATLSIPKNNQNKKAEPVDTLFEKSSLMCLNLVNPYNQKSSSEVLVMPVVAVPVEIDLAEDQVVFTHHKINYKATKLIDGTYSLRKVILKDIASEDSSSDSEDGAFFDGQGQLNDCEKVALDDDFPFDENETLILCKDTQNNFYLAPHEDSHIIETDAKNEFIRLNDSKYFLKSISGDKFQVKGESVKGMVQARVENIFTHAEGARDLCIVAPSFQRDLFFDRIDLASFIESFILTMLIRPQDGKIINLEQSNVLFQTIEDAEENKNPFDPKLKLRPILIDLDETLPPQNGFSVDPQFTEKNLKKVHSVRCGLMGFPQVRCALKNEDKKLVVDHLERIVKIKNQIKDYMIHAERNENSANATMEIIEKFSKFLGTYAYKENPWTLETLFFEIFPEYQKQWEMLGDEDPATKASRIGLESEETLAPRRKS